GLEELERGRGGFAEVDRGRREPRQIDWFLQTAGEDRKAADVIGVLVRDQDGVDAPKFLADGGKPLPGFAHAQPSVDQDTRSFSREKRRVPRTATGQSTELYDGAASFRR